MREEQLVMVMKGYREGGKEEEGSEVQCMARVEITCINMDSDCVVTHFLVLEMTWLLHANTSRHTLSQLFHIEHILRHSWDTKGSFLGPSFTQLQLQLPGSYWEKKMKE